MADQHQFDPSLNNAKKNIFKSGKYNLHNRKSLSLETHAGNIEKIDSFPK